MYVWNNAATLIDMWGGERGAGWMAARADSKCGSVGFPIHYMSIS